VSDRVPPISGVSVGWDQGLTRRGIFNTCERLVLRRRTTLLLFLLAATVASVAMASAASADVQLTASSYWVHRVRARSR
jgi:hypothetical protein